MEPFIERPTGDESPIGAEDYGVHGFSVLSESVDTFPYVYVPQTDCGVERTCGEELGASGPAGRPPEGVDPFLVLLQLVEGLVLAQGPYLCGFIVGARS